MSTEPMWRGADVFDERVELHLPGPTTVPPRVQRAMQEAINHPYMDYRGERFTEMHRQTVAAAKRVVDTDHDLFLLTSSGAGTLEAAMVNLVGPGETVIVCVGGFFGEYLTSIASHLGADLVRVDAAWGEEVDPSALDEALRAHPHARAVFATHCETSTGVVNDVQALARVVAPYEAVFAVDAVSSLVTTPLQADAWGIDMVLSASQKALMLPPGIGVLTVSPKAWSRMEGRRCSSFYFDLHAFREFASRGGVPFTPNVPLVLGLRAALELILAGGMEASHRRHRVLRDMTRAGVRALGLEPYVRDAIASPTLTTVRHGDADALRAELKREMNLVLGGGLGPLKNTLLRIGHLGYTTPLDMLSVLGALETVLARRGDPVTFGAATAAAQVAWRDATADARATPS